MIDLTPLDVRNKRGDFKRMMRGYDPQEVDVFLEMAADRLEVLVRENLQLKERTQSLEDQVSAQTGREQAVQDALVTAQELRADIRAQSEREAEHVLREAEAKGKRLVDDAEAEARRVVRDGESASLERLRELERRIEHASTTIQELDRRRVRFLKEFRGLLAREINVVEVEEDKLPFEDRPIDLDLGARSEAVSDASDASAEPAAEPGDSVSSRPAPPAPMAPPPETTSADPSDSSDSPTSDGVAMPRPVLNVPQSGELGAVGSAAGLGFGAGDEAESSEAAPPSEAVDVADLGPGGETPSEGESDAGVVPDFETLLAEAGIDQGAPPPLPQEDGGGSREPDSFILFDPDDHRRED